MKPVSVGQSGLGEWGNRIAMAIQKVPQLRLVACYDPVAEHAREYGDRFGVEVVNSFDDLLELNEIEAVVLTSPNQIHSAQAQAAALHGKHIFVEKPIATTIEDARKIIDVCCEEDVILSVGHSVRHYGIFRHSKDLIVNGSLGDVVLVEANRSMPRGFSIRPGEWRWYRDNLPGGVLSQLGIHMIDTCHYLLGPCRRVLSMMSDSHTLAEFADTATVLLEFESGTLGYIGSSYVVDETFCMKIYGTKATLLADVLDGLYMKCIGETSWKRLQVGEIDPEAEELRDFAEAVRQNRRPEASGTEGLAALVVSLAAAECANKGGGLFRERV